MRSRCSLTQAQLDLDEPLGLGTVGTVTVDCIIDAELDG